MRKFVLAATAVLCLVPASVDAHKKSSPAERYFANRCGEQSVSAVKACLHRATIHWNDQPGAPSYSTALYIARRESNFNPNICNTQGSGACGLTQFMPGTWASTPYGGFDVFSAKYNALAFAWGWSHLGPSHWGM